MIAIKKMRLQKRAKSEKTKEENKKTREKKKNGR
jgi:hypothetical protein